MSAIELTIIEKEIDRYKKGYPLITKDAIHQIGDLPEEGTIVNVIDESGVFVGKGYVGLQNKGFGWILTNRIDIAIDQAFFKKKIEAAILKRQSLFSDLETNAFRIFNGEGDGIGGLLIDYYAGYYVINWYSKGIYKFKEVIIEAMDEIGGFKGIYEKKRFDTKGQYLEDNDFIKGVEAPSPLVVKENGMHFAIHLNDGAMVGIFLDQRDVRKAVRDTYSSGKRVLNTFSYTGAFSVAAALGGAEKTTSVDLAKRSREKTEEQFSLNGINIADQDIVVMDVFDYFKYAKRKELLFDVVIVDPPSFARSKKMTFSTAKDYPNLLREIIAITEKNGVIIASTNNATIGLKKFKSFIDQAFKEEKIKYRIVEQFSLPKDFSLHPYFIQGSYLKVVIVERIG